MPSFYWNESLILLTVTFMVDNEEQYRIVSCVWYPEQEDD